MAKRYTATRTDRIVGSDTEVWEVRVSASMDPVSVWRDRDGTCRCTRCSGPLSAMLTTCPHAKAVKRAAGVTAAPAPAPKLDWCQWCGEGVTTFCRGALTPCPKGLNKIIAHGVQEAPRG